MICIRCGNNNCALEGICAKCGAVLPRIPDMLKLPVQRRGHLDTMTAMCEDIRCGSLSQQEFEERLASIEGKVMLSLENLKSLRLTEIRDAEIMEMLREEHTLSVEGTEMMLEAIAFIGSGQDYFEQGLSLAESATELLNRSMDMSHEVNMRLGASENSDTESLA